MSRNVTGSSTLAMKRSGPHCNASNIGKNHRSRRIENGWSGRTTRKLLHELEFLALPYMQESMPLPCPTSPSIAPSQYGKQMGEALLEGWEFCH